MSHPDLLYNFPIQQTALFLAANIFNTETSMHIILQYQYVMILLTVFLQLGTGCAVTFTNAIKSELKINRRMS